MLQAASSGGAPSNHDLRGSGSLVSQGPFEFAGNNNVPLRTGGVTGSTIPRSTLEMPLQIRNDASENPRITHPQNEIEDELLKLRRENELLRASLYKAPPKQQQAYAAIRTQQ
jgi:hypothetical protein